MIKSHVLDTRCSNLTCVVRCGVQDVDAAVQGGDVLLGVAGQARQGRLQAHADALLRHRHLPDP
eukprot:320967-Rhodomonas_salina.1